MTLILTNKTSKNLPTGFQRFHLENQGVNLGSIKDAKTTNEIDSADGTEQDFVQLHMLFKIQYEQFLTDTSDEIAKRTQRLSELKSIVYGNSSSD